MTVDLDALGRLPVVEVEELACRSHLGVWTARRLGLDMAPIHWEWCELRMTARRLAVVAPREHGKSQTFAVDGTAWESIYNPGLWTYVLSNSADQAKEIKRRVEITVAETAPWMVDGARENNSTTIIFANHARVDVAGFGKRIRGAHPDVIVGDDVLEEGNCLTALQRKRVERWWFGTVGGMAHPGTWRSLGLAGSVHRVWMPPTRVFLVGTPFHASDLLLSMRSNPLYDYRRYSAEFHEEQLVDGLAVEVA